jgi:hypothetical protein
VLSVKTEKGSERFIGKIVLTPFLSLVVFCLSMGVGVFLMTVVVPMLLDNLLEAGKAIPWPRIIVGLAA